MARRGIFTPVAVAALALVLVSGSADAGPGVRKNSVDSRAVKNNSLTTKDVRNKTLTKTDLKVGTVPDVYTFIDTVPGDGVQRTVISVPGFSRVQVTCSASSHSIFFGFGPGSPIPPGTLHQQHGLAGSDITDNTPVGGATLTGPGGGVGFGISGGSQPGAGLLTRGDYWGRSSTRLAHGSWSLSYPSAGGCLARIQIVVQRLATPKPLPRTSVAGRAEGAGGCEESGAAYCVAG